MLNIFSWSSKLIVMHFESGEIPKVVMFDAWIAFITLSVLTSFCMLCEFAHRTAVLGMSVAPVSRHLLSALCQSVLFFGGKYD